MGPHDRSEGLAELGRDDGGFGGGREVETAENEDEIREGEGEVAFAARSN